MAKANTGKQKNLPGMEDRKLADLNDAAEKYAARRDKRMAILKEEIELKNAVHDLMRKHDKKKYVYENLEITIVPGEEKVKVKVHKEDVDDEEESE